MCTCSTCKQMCRCPCWPSPEEANKLMKLGYGEFMMLDYRDMQDKSDHWYRVYVICPANDGFEGKDAPWMPSAEKKGCVFQDRNGLCELHHVCKPIEGRWADCKGNNHGHRDQVAKMWDNAEGRTTVAAWKRKFYTPYQQQREDPEYDRDDLV